MHRVHLYGASNLWLSRRAALAGLRARYDGPLGIGLASDPGAPYGLSAGNALVRYPPLRLLTRLSWPSWLMPAMTSPMARTPALALGWITELATRLERQGARVLVTGTPLENLRTIPPWLFLAVRSLLLPRLAAHPRGSVAGA